MNQDVIDLMNQLTAEQEKVRQLREALSNLVKRIEFNGGIGEYKGGPGFVMKYAKEALVKIEAKK